MSNKELKIAEVKMQIDALHTMPEGTVLSRTENRTMTERRRARYIKEGMLSLEYIKAMPEECFNDKFMNKDVLFDYCN